MSIDPTACGKRIKCRESLWNVLGTSSTGKSKAHQRFSGLHPIGISGVERQTPSKA